MSYFVEKNIFLKKIKKSIDLMKSIWYISNASWKEDMNDLWKLSKNVNSQ